MICVLLQPGHISSVYPSIAWPPQGESSTPKSGPTWPSPNSGWYGILHTTPSHLRKHSQLMEKNTEAAASAAATVTVAAAIAASASIAASAAPPWHQQQKQQRRPQIFFLFRAKAHFVQKLNLQFFSIWSSYIFLYLSLSFSLSPPLSLSHSLNGLSLHLCLINVLIEEVRPRPN